MTPYFSEMSKRHTTHILLSHLRFVLVVYVLLCLCVCVCLFGYLFIDFLIDFFID